MPLPVSYPEQYKAFLFIVKGADGDRSVLCFIGVYHQVNKNLQQHFKITVDIGYRGGGATIFTAFPFFRPSVPNSAHIFKSSGTMIRPKLSSLFRP